MTTKQEVWLIRSFLTESSSEEYIYTDGLNHDSGCGPSRDSGHDGAPQDLYLWESQKSGREADETRAKIVALIEQLGENGAPLKAWLQQTRSDPSSEWKIMDFESWLACAGHIKYEVFWMPILGSKG